MIKRQLMTWGIVSWVLFTLLNLVVSLHLFQLQVGSTTMTDFYKVTLISFALYFAPLIWGAVGHNSGFYILGLVIIVYSFGLVNLIVTVTMNDAGALLAKVILTVLSVGIISLNLYWILLGFRYRKNLDVRRDEALYQKLNAKKSNQSKEGK